ncbi:hypothetical protein AeNC1_011026, partial [Aphanomyces euteiches]
MSTPPASPTQSELERAGAIEIMSNELGELKRLLDHQKQEIELMRAQSNATKSTSTATENEAKDLLRKVRFDGKNFSTFKAKFEGVCRLRHIWGIISGTETLDDSATQQQLAEFSDKANLAKSYLQTSLSDEVFDMVREDKTPAEMWQTLIDNYEKKE